MEIKYDSNRDIKSLNIQSIMILRISGQLYLTAQSLYRMAMFESYKDGLNYYTLDSVSLLALSRCLIDQCLFFVYICNPDKIEPNFNLRYVVFQLHFANQMLKLENSDSEEYRQQITLLRNKILMNSDFQKIRRADQKRILTGKYMFIKPHRDIALECGWKSDFFDKTYTFLSANIHYSPLSFFKTGGIDFDRPTTKHFTLAAMAFELPTKSLESATKNLINYFGKYENSL